jgi:N6-adenosine-specific RNA methylase IME4
MTLATVDMGTGEIIQSGLPTLPANPSTWPTVALTDACRIIFEQRDAALTLTVDAAQEALQRTKAIEQYVREKEAKSTAARAVRVLETAVGEALGDAPTPAETGARGGRGNKGLSSEVTLSHNDRARFRLMAKYRSVWWPKLQETPLSRKQVLELIDRARNPDDGSYDVGREYCTTDDLDALAAEVESGARAPFGTVYADPAWQYGNQGTRASTEKHYVGMSVDEICELPVARVAAEQSHLHLWTTNAFLFDAKRVMEAWGYTYKSCYVWVKPQIGMGNYWRVSHEFLLLGVRGNLTFAANNLRSWGEFRRGQHSAKPEQIRDLVHVASPGPRLELFARRAVEGWTCWGNEIAREVFAA